MRLAPCPPIMKRSILISSGGEPAARAAMNFSRSGPPCPGQSGVPSGPSTVMWGNFCWKAEITAFSASSLVPPHLTQ